MKLILKNKWVCILVIEAVILAALTCYIGNKNTPYGKTLQSTDLFITEDCPDAIQNENGISIDRTGSERSEKSLVLACGPFSELPRGNYRITYHYETDTNDSTYSISTDNKAALDADFMTDLDGYFVADQTSLSTQVKILKHVESFEIQCQYYGTGTFTLHSIDIERVSMNYVEVSILGLLFLFVDLCIVFWKKIRKKFEGEQAKYMITLLLLVFFSNVILYIKGVHLGSDIEFHLLRIEGIKEAFLSGQFPSRIQPEFVKGYGYASGVMYPDLFLYIPAVLRLIGFNLMAAYKCFVFSINVITVAVAFYSFKGIFQENKIALLGTVMYTLAPYRMIDVYYRAAVGEYCALIGLPLIAYGIFLLLQKNSEGNEKRGLWIPLSLGFSIVIESHILSAIFVTFFTGIIFLLFWKRTFTKKCFLNLCWFAAGVFTLNAWFIIPWLDYYRLPLNTFTDTIEKNGLMLAQIFINGHIGEVPGFNKMLSDGMIGETPFGIGYAILVTSALFVIYGIKKNELLGKVSLSIGVMAVVFATYNFPWDKLAENRFLSKVIMNIQFPWRFLMIATITLIICGCVGVQKASISLPKNFLILCAILLSIYGFTAVIDGALQRWEVEDYGIASLNTFTTGLANEYMLEGTDVDQLKRRGNDITASSDLVTHKIVKKQGTKLTIDVASQSEKEEFVDVPLLLYPGYKAEGRMMGLKLNVTYSDNNTVRVFIPARYSDHIDISFSEKWYWRVGEIMSVMSLLFMIGLTVDDKEKIKQRKKHE